MAEKKYRDKDGKIITFSRWRIMKRREYIALLFDEMMPEYNSFMQLYTDIASRVNKCGKYGTCSYNTVVHDLRITGKVNNTPHSRIGNDIRKGDA